MLLIIAVTVSSVIILIFSIWLSLSIDVFIVVAVVYTSSAQLSSSSGLIFVMSVSHFSQAWLSQ